MSTKWFMIGILAAIMLSPVGFAEPFALQATNDVNIGNDPELLPDGRSNADDGLHVRNIANRRRVAMVEYTISTVQQEGESFFDLFLSARVAKDYTGPISVWGINENVENINFEQVTWLNAPGVLNNPLPALDSPVQLDYADLSPLLLTFSPVQNQRTSTEVSPELTAFLNADTNGKVVLLFAETGLGTASSIFRPIDYTSAGTGYPNPAGGEAFGIVIAGDCSKPIWAMNPDPENGANVSISTAQLKWTNPEPNLPGGVITCDVYFGQTEPNTAEPDYDLTALVTGTTADSAALPQLVRNQDYYWVVDVHDTTRSSVARGFIWTFNTQNMTPVVTTSAQYKWLGNAGDQNTATAKLTAKVEDDDFPEPLTYGWKQTGGTAVTFVDPNTILEPTIILPGLGSYEFTLRANDSQKEGTGVLKVTVSADACLAAKANTNFYVPGPGDANADCVVDMKDFALFAADWLECHPYMQAIGASCI